MSVTDYLEDFNDFLFEKDQIDAMGTTSDFIPAILDNDYTSISHSFFKPMKTIGSLKKIYSPISAPIGFSLLALEFILDAFGNAITGIYDALMYGDSNRFKRKMHEVFECLKIASIALVAAMASPVLNLVDLIGSIITTVTDLFCTKNDDFRSENYDSEEDDYEFSDSESESSSLSYN